MTSRKLQRRCLLFLVGVVALIFIALLCSRIHHYSSSRTSEFIIGPEAKNMEHLVYLADSLAKASYLTQSYEEKKALNSMFYKVKGLIDDLLTSQVEELMVNSVDEGTPLHFNKFYSRVTIVFNFVHNSEISGERIEKVIQDTAILYPDVHIVVGLLQSLTVHDKLVSNLRIAHYNSKRQETDVWKSLLSYVTTEYVYIGRDIVNLSESVQLNTLVSHMINVGAAVVSSSVKSVHTGRWSHSCQQSKLENYTLVYTPGYYMSVDSCLLCNHVSTPFLTHTHIFQHVPLKAGMTSTSGFSLWFQELVKSQKIIISCLESMTYADDQVRLSDRDQWLDIAKNAQIESIYLGDGTHLTFNCDEADTKCPFWKPPSMALSHCCLNELSSGIKTVMKACKNQSFFCELNDGTLLGTLKFEGILPWEIDADISVDKDHFTAFMDVVAMDVVPHGYTFEDNHGFYKFYTPMGWFIEIFPVSSTDTSKLNKDNISPTKILLDGEYVATPESPGLFGRNRYGREIYQHANHWRGQGGTSSWQFYEAGKFAKCIKPGHHSCLDQFVADGSLKFNQYLL